MHAHWLAKMINRRAGLPDPACLLDELRYATAPVLHAHKPATILTLAGRPRGRSNDRLHIWTAHREWLLERLGLSAHELCRRRHCACVLFHNPRRLARRLFEPAARTWLRSRGYPPDAALPACFALLGERFRAGSCPDEIGLFLGIPLPDVQAYIRHGGRHYRVCRYWKVYHRSDRAQKVFDAYDHARRRVALSG